MLEAPDNDEDEFGKACPTCGSQVIQINMDNTETFACGCNNGEPYTHYEPDEDE